MTVRSLLVPVFCGVDLDATLDGSLALAGRLGSSIEALYVRPNVAVELAYAANVMTLQSIDYAGLDELSRTRAEQARLRFEAWRDTHPESRGRTYWAEQEGYLEEVLERCCRLADLVVLPYPEFSHPETERAFDVGVFASGRPCLVFKGRSAVDPCRHVLVAWNGSLEATRAIAGAMPILAAASAVTVFSAPDFDGDDRHGKELATALGKHGIDARVETPAHPEAGVGAGLLTLAASVGATLIVMGAYTHRRIRQRLLGGVTRHVLAHATIPLLMAH